MDPLERDDLLSLENYALERAEFRARVMAHKKQRTVHLGGHLTLIFEDRLSIQYQVQEMLRIERIFEPAGIQDELDAYNSLIPDGDNLKATLLIEYDDVEQRKRELVRLRDIEHAIALTVHGRAHAVHRPSPLITTARCACTAVPSICFARAARISAAVNGFASPCRTLRSNTT